MSGFNASTANGLLYHKSSHKENVFVISSEEFKSLLGAGGGSEGSILLDLANAIRYFARAPTSGFLVGAAALSSDGRVFLGVNVEFARQPLDTAIHAEQFAMSNAAMNGAPGVTHLAATASPCGHCRQFCMELGAPNALRVIVDNTSTPPSLDELLPFGFGPAALGVLDGHFLKHKHFDASAFDVVGVATTRVTIPATASTATVFRAASADLSRELAATATAALARSYAPYTGAVCGCAIWFEDATTVDVERLKPTIAVGCYIESCAYNPSLSALRSALADMITRQAHWRDVRAIAIAELDGAKISHVEQTKAVVTAIAHSDVQLISVRLRRKDQ